MPELGNADDIFLQTHEEDALNDRKAAVAELTVTSLRDKLPAVQAERTHVGVSDIWRGNAPTGNRLAAEEVLEAIIQAEQ